MIPSIRRYALFEGTRKADKIEVGRSLLEVPEMASKTSKGNQKIVRSPESDY